MGGKASSPVVTHEQLIQTCNMRDVVSVFAAHNGLIVIAVMVVVILLGLLCVTLVCLTRRSYRKKLRELTIRSPRPLLHVPTYGP